MIEARHTAAGTLVARIFSGWRLGRAFREVRLIGDYTDEGLPLLMLSNHFSWWDGFIQYRLNSGVFHRKLYVMMLEEQLRRNLILNRCGCFSIRKGGRGIIESLGYCAEVMKGSGNMLLIFPQGRIESMHTRRVKFEAGIGYLTERIANPYGIVLNVNLPDYFSRKKPVLNVWYRYVRPDEFDGPDTLEKLYNDFYDECVKRQAETE